MSESIRLRKLSPVELVDAHLQQIARHNESLNAFVLRFESEARELAKKAAAQELTGPLHGIPLTIKDSFDLQGLPTLCGSRLRLEHRASEDSWVAKRIQAAGGIFLGKTNCPEFLGNWETDNYVTGRTNNPWDLERTAGGSSGGESAAVAAFCSAGGIGSDGGGSIRMPAHFCGIAGLKPTPGRVPATGHYPVISHPGGLLGVGGPMARTVQDVRLLFEVLAGHDPGDPFSAPVPLRGVAKMEGRIGVMEQFLHSPVEPFVAGCVRKAAQKLQDSGLAVDEFRPAGLEKAHECWWFFFGELSATFTRELISGSEADVHWTGTELMRMTDPKRSITGREVVEQLGVRDRMRATLFRQMEQFPILLIPVCGVPAFRHRQRTWDIGGQSVGLIGITEHVTPWNLLGMPGLSVPMGLSPEGLPVGVQLIAMPHAEELLLHVGEKLEEARGPLPAPPGFA